MLNRRGFLGACAALLTVARVVRAHSVGYGYVDVHRAYARGWVPARVYLDGVDVTHDCRALNDREGYVVLMKRNPQGKHYVQDGRVATETRHGHVLFTPNVKGV